MNSIRLKQAHILFALGVIVLPQAKRAEQLEYSMMHSRVVESMYIVADAVERRAEENSGVYPPSIGRFQDYLPRGLLRLNPQTLARTEPVDGAAATPGQIGYTVVVQSGFNVGYTLTQWGRFSQYMTLARYPGAKADE